MTIEFGEVCLAVLVCSLITIVIYMASWYQHDEKDMKKADSSNTQGIEDDVPAPRGRQSEVLNFDPDVSTRADGDIPSGQLINEKSDITRLQDEDLRARVTEKFSREHSISEDYVTIDHQTSLSDYDPVVHPDGKLGRLHLSVRYDKQQSHLSVQLLGAEGLIRPDQSYAPEMMLTFTLIGPNQDDEMTEKHTRIVVENAPITWKQPMTFATAFGAAIKQNLYITATNETDPAAPNDRDVSVS